MTLFATDWLSVERTLDERGWADAGPLLTPQQCEDLRDLYGDATHFRSKVVMQRHSYGHGEYQYFGRPLPSLVQSLREHFYAGLHPIANRWSELLNLGREFPNRYEDFLAQCHAAEQNRPTPLILRYQPGDYNRLHQDLYGPCVFPLQVVILLSNAASFTGGEFVLTEQRARMQSRAHVVPLTQGHGVVFPVYQRPVRTTRGYSRANMRHGVSELRSGTRFTLGVILHDAA